MSMGRKCYLILFIDNHTHHVWLYTMAQKSETFSKPMEWKALVEYQMVTLLRKYIQIMAQNMLYLSLKNFSSDLVLFMI